LLTAISIAHTLMPMNPSDTSPTSSRYVHAFLLLVSVALILSAFVTSFW